MGWKASTIIIHKPTDIDNKKLLQELGFEKLKKIKDEPFEVAINPKDNNVYIGSYKNNKEQTRQNLDGNFGNRHKKTAVSPTKI